MHFSIVVIRCQRLLYENLEPYDVCNGIKKWMSSPNWSNRNMCLRETRKCVAITMFARFYHSFSEEIKNFNHSNQIRCSYFVPHIKWKIEFKFYSSIFGVWENAHENIVISLRVYLRKRSSWFEVFLNSSKWRPNSCFFS